MVLRGCHTCAVSVLAWLSLMPATHSLEECATPAPPPPVDPLTGLAEALAKVFLVIFIGHVMCRTGIFPTSALGGIGALVGKLALPALLFKGMANLDLPAVKIEILGALVLAKIVAFMIATLFVVFFDSAKGGRRLAKIGIYGIFVTQSNDIAIGLPVIGALFPDFQSYLYLSALPQLALINGFGFTLMEVGAAKIAAEQLSSDTDDDASGKQKAVGVQPKKIARGVLLNPVFLMVVLGVVFNVIVNAADPNYTDLNGFSKILDGTLGTLGGAFGCGALFLVGAGSQGKTADGRGKLSVLQGRSLATPLFLVVVKIILAPIITRYLLLGILSSSSGFAAQDISDAASFGFIYGSLPTAPSVSIFASLYNVEPDLMGATLVLCLFVSAPLMFVTATLVNASGGTVKLQSLIVNTGTNMGIFSFVGALWVLLAACFFKGHRRFPMDLVSYVAFGQVFHQIFHMVCVFQQGDPLATSSQIIFGFMEFFRMGARVWGALVVLCMVVHMARGRDKARSIVKYFHVVAWTAPTLWMGLLFGLGVPFATPLTLDRCWYRYGQPQYYMEAILAVSFGCINLGCIIAMQRIKKKSVARVVAVESTETVVQEFAPEKVTEDDTGDLDKASDEYVRFQVINIWFLLKMVMKAFLAITLVAEDIDFGNVNGTVLQIQFLAAVLEEGEGVLLFFAFGLKKDLIDYYRSSCARFVRWTRVVLYGVEDIDLLGDEDNCDYDPRHLAVLLKLDNAGLIQDRRWRLKKYKSCFIGSEVVTWMVEHKLAATREAAVALGQEILLKRMIRHAVSEHSFQDKGFFYVIEPSVVFAMYRRKKSVSGDEVVGITKEPLRNVFLDLVCGKNFGTIDIYVVLSVGDHSQKSAVQSSSDKSNPTWNERVLLGFTNDNDEVGVQCWEKRIVGKDVLIGEVKLPVDAISEALASGGDADWHVLSLDDAALPAKILIGFEKAGAMTDMMSTKKSIRPPL